MSPRRTCAGRRFRKHSARRPEVGGRFRSRCRRTSERWSRPHRRMAPRRSRPRPRPPSGTTPTRTQSERGSGPGELPKPHVPDRPRADPDHPVPVRPLGAPAADVRVGCALAVGRAEPSRLAAPRGHRRLRRRAGGAPRSARQAAGHDRRPHRAGAGDDRHRPLRLDAGRPTSSRPGWRRPRRRPPRSSTQIPDKVRVGAVAFNQRAEVLQSPTRDHDAVREAIAVDPARRQHRHRRRDHRRARDDSRARRPPRSCCSPTASRCAAATRSRPRRRPRSARSRSTRSRSAPPAARSTTASRCRPIRRRSRRSPRPPAARRSPRATSKSLDQVYKRLGSQVATEKRPLEVTSLFAGGALGLMVLSALSSIRWFGRLL